ncbi:flocculation protein FLO11-like [Haliotis rubra]|uniref:flocculation protein FLO11-like n=1 Tax=Haliotis rubra TaxID=36100 RepID=UPI001EE6202E|nr:flocculation protein FLO11-like [Haliotis rubra]
MTRDIPTDRFVAIRMGTSVESPQKSTYEWRFATRSDERSVFQTQYARVQQSQGTFSGGVPVQIKQRALAVSCSPSVPVESLVLHPTPPTRTTSTTTSRPGPTSSTGTSAPATVVKKKRVLQFAVPGSYRSQISSNRETFKHDTLSVLASSLQISPLRINDINLKLDVTNNVSVTFTLLDTAPVRGDVKVNITETSLDSAVATLANLVKDHAFLIPAVFGSQFEAIPAIPTSFRDTTEEGETTSTSATTSPTPPTSPITRDTSSSDTSSSDTSSTASSTASFTTSAESSKLVKPTETVATRITQTKPWRKPTVTPATKGYATHVPRPSKPHVTTQRLPRQSKPHMTTQRLPRPSKPHVTTQRLSRPSTPSVTTQRLPGPSLANIMCSNNQRGYKTGAVVGVSVAMVVVGGVLGTGAAIFMSRRRNFGFC